VKFVKSTCSAFSDSARWLAAKWYQSIRKLHCI